MQLIDNGKPFGFWTLTALVSGTMIGSGIFLLPAQLAQLGSVSLFSWIVTTLGALCLGMVLAKVSALVPRSGGPYAFVKAGLGDFMGFQTAYMHWIALWVSCIAIILAMVSYLSIAFPALAEHGNIIITTVVTIWLLTIVNIFGPRPVGVLQVVTAALKVIILLVIIMMGVAYFSLDNLHAYMAPAGKSTYSLLASAAGVTLWSFIGIESATIPYTLVKNPRRNIPLATFVGIVVASIVYITGTVIVMGALPDLMIDPANPFFLLSESVFGSFGSSFALIGAVIACFGCVNGLIFLQNQVANAAAEDGLFPRIFAQKNRHGVPVLGFIITAMLQTILLFLASYRNFNESFHIIVFIASLAALMPYLYAAAAATVIFKRQPLLPQRRSYLPFVLLSLLAALYSFWIIMISGQQIILYGSFLVFAGVILYAVLYERP